MFHHTRRVAHVDHREGMRPAPVADQQRIALRVVAGVLRPLRHADHAAVGVLAPARRNALRDDAAAGVAADVDHLRTRVGLLEIVGHGHRVELPDGVVAREDAARIFPRDRRTRLDLRPRQAGVLAADAALGDEVINAAPALLVAGIPVLNGGILHLGVPLDHDLDHGGVQLVLVALRRGAPFEVAHVGALVGHDQRAFELPRAGGVDAEIGRQLHRAAHPLGDVAERAVGEDRGVQRSVEVVGIGHDAPEVFFHQLGKVAQRLGDRTEEDALLGQYLPESGLDRHGVHHGVDRDARQRHLLLERNAQFVERALQLGVDLVHRTELLFGLGSRVVDNVLKVDRGDRQVGPGRRLQRQPMAVGRHAPLGHPLRLALFGGDQPHDLLRKTLADGFGFDVRREAVLVFLLSDILQYVFLVFCHYKRNIMQRYKIPFTFLPSPLQIRFRNGQTAKKRRGTFRASFMRSLPAIWQPRYRRSPSTYCRRQPSWSTGP